MAGLSKMYFKNSDASVYSGLQADLKNEKMKTSKANGPSPSASNLLSGSSFHERLATPSDKEHMDILY